MLSIGRLSQFTGLKVQTIRYDEDTRLIINAAHGACGSPQSQNHLLVGRNQDHLDPPVCLAPFGSQVRAHGRQKSHAFGL